MKRRVYKELLMRKSNGQKSLAVLIDPDKFEKQRSTQLIDLIGEDDHIDFIFLGGSLVSNYNFGEIIEILREKSRKPVVLFPGHYFHIAPEADAMMFLSLISGRNPELLIGQQVIAAPLLKSTGLEIISTGYILIDGGKSTTASYMSSTLPIPADKPEIAKCTAMAGEMLGMKMIYLDAGSGASLPVSKDMIRAVSKAVDIPLVVGGGLNTLSKIDDALNAGADMIVVGNGIEKNPNLLVEVSEYLHRYNGSLNIDQ